MKSVAGISEKFRKHCVIHKATETVSVTYTGCNFCGHIFRWVEFRSPNYCPECGHKFNYGDKNERIRSV